tara:strand:+ start:2436 stop:2663 length:228 start_codon:yes stop_codon:yes gene_type:complete
MTNKAFHIRVKVTWKKVFFLKGVCVSQSRKKAIGYVMAETDNYMKLSGSKTEHKIEIVECKELRTDFLMSTNGKD